MRGQLGASIPPSPNHSQPDCYPSPRASEMSFYEPQAWQAPVRQSSWEQPPPPSRSGASSASQREDTVAFTTQFEDVDRAIDNLVKSGKIYAPGSRAMPPHTFRPGADFAHRPHHGRHPGPDFDHNRPHQGGHVQNFYASQRHQGRHNDGDSMLQAKKRMAAQRERELRNYHQEQQYNRSVLSEMSSTKSDRSMSPSTLSEEGRRDLIARQHRALYGGEGAAFVGQTPFENVSPREQQTPGSNTTPGAVRGPSPFGTGAHAEVPGSAANAGQDGRPEKAGSPSAQTAPGFGSFDSQLQSSGPKSSSPTSGEETSHSRQISKSTTAPISGAMGPIGSRPNAGAAPNQALNKRTTSPLPASLGYGFGSNDQNSDRAASSNSNTNNQKESSQPGIGAWGTGSGVWGNNKIGTTSVWG
ncbi:hypothetical protein, variant 1 [Exophiala mesophila]|uniref:Uncharacterized protein n=2 Tax=Exophiala mesophila TaxID=212818 RepID=A0A0D1ZVE9_EXOME|nr:hypothetical protein, variant 1 [Exophiala mesophila]KIV90808.1 hypothetical protein, variant 1 [Exophiala mesophila]